MSTSSERINKIADFTQEHLHKMAKKYPSPNHNPTYRWEHTLRVASYGKRLAEKEGATAELVIAACLLHDIAHFESDDDYKDHGRRGAKIIRPYLEDLGYSTKEVDNICYSVALHVDGNAGFDHPETLESQIVSDADNIDRFGAFRLLQWCVDDMYDYNRLIEKLSQRIERLEYYRQNNPLETEAGRILFSKQLDLQIGFFLEIIEESKLTALPIIS